MRSVLLALAAWGCLWGHIQAGESYVWWEGEHPLETNYPDDRAFAPNTDGEKAQLSGGAWLQTGKGVAGAKLFAKYAVEVPRAGTYRFWARVFYHHGPFRWRFGEQAWQTCDNRVALADSVELRLHLCANWKSCGDVTLPAGKQTLHIELMAEPGQNTASAFDCFLLSPVPFSPRGKMKPGEKYNRAPEGWFPFEPDRDAFGADAKLDLRGLNEAVAGSKGFLIAKGDALAFEKDPTPVRFWSVCVGPNTIGSDHDSLDFLARRLAKMGVNLVRFHGTIHDKSGSDPAKPDPKQLDDLHYFQSALKKNGIYLYVSHYYVLGFDVKAGYGLPGFEAQENKKPFGLLFFHPRMQEIYRGYTRGLLTSKNPYTGLTLAADPAVAIVEVLNEDSLFFWTFNPGKTIPKACLEPLEQQFGAWLAKQYGNLEQAKTAWGAEKHPEGDAFAQGRAALYPAGTLSGQDWAKNGRNERRASDQARFFTELQHGFYASTRSWMRDELGVRGLTIATNWTTVDNRVLLPLEKYSNTACELLDRHAYFTSPRITPRGYALNQGDLYTDRSALHSPEGHPVQEMVYNGMPTCVSEFNWNMPNRFRTEQCLLGAAYGRLQGIDALVHFAVDTSDWPNRHSVCSVYAPATLGCFPAAALLYRQGLVQEGPVVAREGLKLDDLYAFKGSASAGPVNMDPAAKADLEKSGRVELDALKNLDPLAHLVGQVAREISNEPGKSSLSNLGSFVDRGRKTAKSATGELAWDWGIGLATVNAPRAQGATGFLAQAKTVNLADVVLEIRNEYGMALAVSLDGKPLKESARVLVQVMSEDSNFGWKTTEVEHKDEKSGKVSNMKRLDEVGAAPFVVRKLEGAVSLKRADAASLKVTALDANGYAREAVAAVSKEAGVLRIALLPDVLYYVVEK